MKLCYIVRSTSIALLMGAILQASMWDIRAAGYTVTDLGEWLGVRSVINNQGMVAGHYKAWRPSTPNGTSGSLLVLSNTLPEPNSYLALGAPVVGPGINDNDRVVTSMLSPVAYYFDNWSYCPGETFTWVNEKAMYCQYNTNGYFDQAGDATLVNCYGASLGVFDLDTTPGYDGFIATSGQAGAGEWTTAASDINNSGKILVNSREGSGDATTLVALYDGPNSYLAPLNPTTDIGMVGYSLNDSNQFVGWMGIYCIFEGGDFRDWRTNRAFLATSNSYIQLGHLSTSTNHDGYSSARGINNAGMVVGTSGTFVIGEGEYIGTVPDSAPFYWIPDSPNGTTSSNGVQALPVLSVQMGTNTVYMLYGVADAINDNTNGVEAVGTVWPPYSDYYDSNPRGVRWSRNNTNGVWSVQDLRPYGLWEASSVNNIGQIVGKLAPTNASRTVLLTP
jgi:hypothetical protein